MPEHNVDRLSWRCGSRGQTGPRRQSTDMTRSDRSVSPADAVRSRHAPSPTRDPNATLARTHANRDGVDPTKAPPVLAADATVAYNLDEQLGPFRCAPS